MDDVEDQYDGGVPDQVDDQRENVAAADLSSTATTHPVPAGEQPTSPTACVDVEPEDPHKDNWIYRNWPPLSSFLFLLLVFAMAYTLKRNVDEDVVFKGTACHCAADVFGKKQWNVWVATAPTGTAIAVVMFVRGLTFLGRLPNLMPDAPHRDQGPAPPAITGGMVWRHFALALVWGDACLAW